VRQFIKKADESLYDAKRNGRNKIVMYNALQIKTE
jgi:PleD family two-component response regulator